MFDHWSTFGLLWKILNLPGRFGICRDFGKDGFALADRSRFCLMSAELSGSLLADSGLGQKVARL
jgi:hypothetical protein